MREGEFLFGKALSERIRAICAEDKVDCAVAFWGGAIRNSLFPRWDAQTIRIVCDIAMGCNSQKSLKRFGAPDNCGLRVLDGLHAKLYVSEAGAVVGSANASLNGIGMASGEEGNCEAGVFFPAGSAGWREALKFFDRCWQTSCALDKRQLERARLFARDPGREIGSEGRKTESILDLVAGYPEEFGDVLFFGEHEEIDPAEQRRLEARYAKAERAKHFEPAARDFIINYPASKLPVRAPLVMFYWLERSPELTCYTDVVYVDHGAEAALFGKQNWKGFWKGRSVSRPLKTEALRLDGERLQTFENRQWAFSATQLAQALHT